MGKADSFDVAVMLAGVAEETRQRPAGRLRRFKSDPRLQILRARATLFLLLCLDG